MFANIFTDKQTNAAKNITSLVEVLGGGNSEAMQMEELQ